MKTGKNQSHSAPPDSELEKWHGAIGAIVGEWGHIGNMLRLAVNTLASSHPGISPLKARSGFSTRIDVWSQAMNAALEKMPDTGAKKQLPQTVGRLRKQLPIRNTISHGEATWGRNLFLERVAIFISETVEEHGPRKKRGRVSPRIPEEAAVPQTAYGTALLDRAEYRIREFELQELSEAARELAALRHAVQQLCHLVAPQVFPEPLQVPAQEHIALKVARGLFRLLRWRTWHTLFRQLWT